MELTVNEDVQQFRTMLSDRQLLEREKLKLEQKIEELIEKECIFEIMYDSDLDFNPEDFEKQLEQLLLKIHALNIRIISQRVSNLFLGKYIKNSIEDDDSDYDCDAIEPITAPIINERLKFKEDFLT